ncbi:MAG TPA: response regulator [Stellaceae bacterium]|nr:response regulator [Stellaceae bacterium]
MAAFSLSKLDRLRVMIVDNSPMMRDLVQGVLESVGVKQFMPARDGSHALASLSAFGPHLAFVDWEMEPMCGLDFVRAVRALPERENPFLPIIMLTSHAEEPWVIEARNAGVHEYLIKPATGAAILARLATVINNPRPFVRNEGYFGPARRAAGDPADRASGL